MGQAKQKRDRFGGIVGGKVAIYRETQTVLAFQFNPDHKSIGSVSIMAEALYHERTPSIFNPDLPLINPPAIQPLYVEEARQLGLAKDTWVIVNPTTLSVRETIDDTSFAASYEKLSGTIAWFAKKGGPEEAVILDADLNAYREGGEAIDLVEFSRGKVRQTAWCTMFADKALSVQASTLMALLGEHGGTAADQLAHTTALFRGARKRAFELSAGANADLTFFRRCERGGDEFPIPANVDFLLYPVFTFSEVSAMGLNMPTTDGVRQFCRVGTEILSSFAPRSIDDPMVDDTWASIDTRWTMLLDRIDPTGEKLGKVTVGEDAARTAIQLATPNSGNYLKDMEAYFATGLHRGVVQGDDGASVELIDVGAARYLVTTRLGDAREVVTWTIVSETE